MLDNTSGQNSNDQTTNSSLGRLDEDQQNDTSATNSDMNEQNDSNKDQPNLDLDLGDKNTNPAAAIHDNERRKTSRANEANDPNDTGSGGMTSGSTKSATDY